MWVSPVIFSSTKIGIHDFLYKVDKKSGLTWMMMYHTEWVVQLCLDLIVYADKWKEIMFDIDVVCLKHLKIQTQILANIYVHVLNLWKSIWLVHGMVVNHPFPLPTKKNLNWGRKLSDHLSIWAYIFLEKNLYILSYYENIATCYFLRKMHNVDNSALLWGKWSWIPCKHPNEWPMVGHKRRVLRCPVQHGIFFEEEVSLIL